ncbi:hypothetical protein AAC387_Pa05g1171 [Persea americana]
MQSNARDEASTIINDGGPGQLPTFPSNALVNLADSREVTVTSEVNTKKVGNQGLSSASLLEAVDPKVTLPKPIVSVSADNTSMATLESNHENPIVSLPRDIVHNILEKIPALVVDLANPFSALEHCSVIEAIFSSSLLKNLMEATKNTLDPGALFGN